MADKNKGLRDELKRKYREVTGCKNVETALNKTLPNDGDMASHDEWLAGAEIFARGNKDTLKAVLK